MAQLVRDVMTSSPVTFSADTPVQRAAVTMRDRDIGDVLVVDDAGLRGIVTDRDIVVRGLAEREDLFGCTLGEVCTENLVAAGPDEDVEIAILRMRENAVRRIPVVMDGWPVGVLSIGDAAIERDPTSILANISAAPGNV